MIPPFAIKTEFKKMEISLKILKLKIKKEILSEVASDLQNAMPLAESNKFSGIKASIGFIHERINKIEKEIEDARKEP